MSTSTTVDGLIGQGDVCIPVLVPVVNDFWDVDPLAVSVAFVVGLLVGGLLTLCCAKCCEKDLANRGNWNDVERAEGEDLKNEKKTNKSKKKKKLKKKSRLLKGRRRNSTKDTDVPLTVITLDEGPGVHVNNQGENQVMGLADALMKSNAEGMRAELSNMDVVAVDDLDRELREESINTMIQMLRVMLHKEMVKGKLSDQQYSDLVNEMQDSVNDVIRSVQQEKEAEIEDLENKFGDNPDELENEIDKLHPKYVNKMNVKMKEGKDKMRRSLANKTELNDEEIEAMLLSYGDQMAEMEKRLGDERARQTQALEDRLSKRRHLADELAKEKELETRELSYRSDTHSEALDSLVDKNKLLERQKDEIMESFRSDLHNIQMKHNENISRSQLTLAEKLKERRQKKLSKLDASQELEREQYLQTSDKATNTAQIMDGYHALLQDQREDREDAITRLDDEEAAEMMEMQKTEQSVRNDEIEKREKLFSEELRKKADLNEKEASKLMKLHYAQMDEFNFQKKQEQKLQRKSLQEKLEQRRLKKEEEALRREKEQEVINEQQSNTINKVLSSQVELDEDAKERILREHAQQTLAVSNQIEMSRLRQEKRLERRLNARKARVAELKEQKNMATFTKTSDKDIQKLQNEIEKQEKDFQEEKLKQRAELRERILAETKSLLEQQEKEMMVLIARLQVGSARRQEVIKKNEQTLKELEAQLADKVTEVVQEDSRANPQVDELLVMHHNQTQLLTEKLEDEKERQQQILRERLESKRLHKEREVEDTLETDAQKDWHLQKKRGAGIASSILSQVMLETRHKAAMKNLEREIETEMTKQREELNAQMEEELQLELQEQKKRFLAQLAAISNMSKEEVTDVVETAVADSGGNENQAKKLARELRQELKRAKTNISAASPYYPRSNTDYTRSNTGYHRNNTDLDNYSRSKEINRPTSALPKSKSAFRDYEDEDYYYE